MDNFVYSSSRMVNITRLSSLPHISATKRRQAQDKERYIKSAVHKQGRSISQRTPPRVVENVKHTIHTQTPLTDFSYEFDAAMYNFKETVRRTLPNSRPHHRVYLPTIIDTKPRSRSGPFPAQAALPVPLCTCKHRPVISRPKPLPKKPVQDPSSSSTTATPKQFQLPSSTYHLSSPPRDLLNTSTPVLAVAIRRNRFDKSPIVEFNGIIGHANRIAFTPFVRHVSTQTAKSNVHVQFEIPDENPEDA